MREMTPAERIERNPKKLEYTRECIKDLNLEIRGTPPVKYARYIVAAGLPFWAGVRKVTGVSISNGRPDHGALRSDDHISTFEIEAPLSDFAVRTEELDLGLDPDYHGVHLNECPECGDERATYRYHASHHIAGSESITCRTCGETFHAKDWG